MTDNQRIQYIDAWRFIAVSFVLLGHLIVHSNLSFLVEAYPFLRRIGRFGTLGVLVFFFISGFVICRGFIYEQKKLGSNSLTAFYVRRTFRILPPLCLYLGMLILLANTDVIAMDSLQLFYSAMFVCNLDFFCGWYGGHLWSLAYEEQFYIIFPLLFVLIGFVKRPPLVLFILFFSVIASVVFRLSGLELGGGYLMHISFLVMGCTAALYEGKFRPLLHQLSPRYWFSVAAILIACVGLVPFPLETYIKTMIYPPCIAFLVLATPVEISLVRVLFHHPAIVYLGKISYTVYLWQQLATAPWVRLPPWATLLFILAVWLFAHLSWQYMEQPFIRIATKWSDSIKRKKMAGI